MQVGRKHTAHNHSTVGEINILKGANIIENGLELVNNWLKTVQS